MKVAMTVSPAPDTSLTSFRSGRLRMDTPSLPTHLTTLPPLYGLMLLEPLIAHAADEPGAVDKPSDVPVSTNAECKDVLLTNPLNGS